MGKPYASVNGAPFPRSWEHVSNWHFDSFWAAMLTIFEITSGEMWPDIMYDTVNAVGYDEPMAKFDAVWPRNASPVYAAYYIAVTIVCTFLMLNVFVGVVIDNYNEMKDEETGSALLSSSQKQWVDSMKLLMSMKPSKVMVPPKRLKLIRLPFYNLVESKAFEVFIMTLIILNTLVMSLKHYPPRSYLGLDT